MRTFRCDVCSSPIYFENRQCGSCGSSLGFEASGLCLHALAPTADAELFEVASRPGASYRPCANGAYDVCNWLVPSDSPEQFCAACRHNRTVPDLSDPAHLVSWREYEFAKHRLFYSLLKLRLPLANRADDPEHGLAFDFLAEIGGTPVITGHENGMIVLNLEEADDATRAARRLKLGEPYRTLLGHLRHESGHYYWDRLVENTSHLDGFRELFGDERADYNEALRNYYASGPAPDWSSRMISGYASAHPWEDFAETWAHYLHIEDTMELAEGFGIAPPCETKSSPGDASFSCTVSRWASLTVMLNSLNRCMGQRDLYPFVLPPPAVARLEFIHSLVLSAAE